MTHDSRNSVADEPLFGVIVQVPFDGGVFMAKRMAPLPVFTPLGVVTM